jgi:hypothetical protein
MTEAPSIALGVIVAPGVAEDVTQKAAADLAEDLRRSYGSVGWKTDLVVDRLVQPPAATTELFDAARRKLLEADWDLAVVVTDIPLRVGRRPVTSHISPTHAIALVSLPALGPLHLRRRLHRTLAELVRQLVGDGGNHALRELATDEKSLFLPALLGHLRLLLGMVRANRPWRLASRLSGALVAAFAAGAYGLVTSDIWRLSGSMGWWRLTVACVIAILVTVFAVIAAHGLWERAPDSRVRDQVVLFNIATTATVVLGIMALYVVLFALVLASAAVLIPAELLERAVGHAPGALDYATVAWFAASFATVAGALGAALESDAAVREAAYATVLEDA